LEITLARLRAHGIREVIVNAHHFAEMIVQYLKANGNFGMRVEVVREDNLLDTGGGLKNAAYFFQDRIEEPFLLHNVDAISTIDLEGMVQFHNQRGALATLAVQHRETSRYLLFDDCSQLCGRRSGKDGALELVRPSAAVNALAFSGIHVISPRIFARMTEEGAFSILALYLRLAAQGEAILAFEDDQAYWRDLGTPQRVMHVAEEIERNPRLIAETGAIAFSQLLCPGES
jgi:NDP-sugar pyrophosphorylase family protein